jgi:hypothetical protein
MTLKVVSVTLMLTGVGLVFAGIGVTYYQPSAPFALRWWMMIGGWGVTVVGIGLHGYRVFTLLKEKLYPPKR